LGEGCLADFDKDHPSPNLRSRVLSLALSRKGRATVLEVKRFAMVCGPGGLR